MAGITDEAQWIILLGFIVSISIFSLALIVNESTLIGQTTSESVLEFPKTQVQDVRSEILEYYENGTIDEIAEPGLKQDLRDISLQRKNAIVVYETISPTKLSIHYNDGITEYNETYEKR
jgi:hypothetical protein